MKNLIVAGIDYSLTSPAIIVHTGDYWDHRHCTAYYFDDRKNAPVNPKCDIRLKYTYYPFWKTPEDRYEQLALWAVAILCSRHVTHAYLEGYAMGATRRTGLVFNIAEAGGVLKNYLHCFNIPFTTVSPAELKKWVTTSGVAKKHELENIFKNETGINDFRTVLGISAKALSPISDIIDAYYLSKYGFIDRTVGITKEKPKKKTKKRGL